MPDATTHIYVSHARADHEQALRLRRWLNRLPGVRAVASDDLRGQGDWFEVSRDRLNASDLFLLLLTPRALDAESVLHELGMAWGAMKPLVLAQTMRTPLQLPIEAEVHRVPFEAFQDEAFRDPDATMDLLASLRPSSASAA
jgi:hypothetical protein